MNKSVSLAFGILFLSTTAAGPSMAATSTCKAEGIHEVIDKNFRLGGIKPPKSWSGIASSYTTLDNFTTPNSGSTPGIKLSTVVWPNDLGFRFINGTVQHVSGGVGPKGSTGSMISKLSGASGWTWYQTLVGKATSTFDGVINAAKVSGASAFCIGNTQDPFFEVGPDTANANTGIVNFSFALPSQGNEAVRGLRDGDSWGASFAAYVNNLATPSSELFFNGEERLMYGVSYGISSSGVPVVDFIPGLPSGYPIAFVESESVIEAKLLDILQNGSQSDAPIFQGTIDLGGYTSSSIGVRDSIKAQVFDVPGPLPAVGAISAFAFSRKLRRRILVRSSSVLNG
jgi:hypothetical protein